MIFATGLLRDSHVESFPDEVSGHGNTRRRELFDVNVLQMRANTHHIWFERRRTRLPLLFARPCAKAARIGP